jgi:peptidoglycan/LPS O-acetylase OafA/YrhL
MWPDTVRLPSRPNLTTRLRLLLVRETSSGAFIPELDGLRFVAITSVVVYHLTHFYLVKSGRTATDALTRALLQGGFGVSLFFVVSGFIISVPFAKAHLAGGVQPSLSRYYLRRLARLEPPYFANLLLMFVLLSFVKPESFISRLQHLLASAVYQHNAIYGSVSSINFVAWSLEIEFQFYVLAPLLAPVFGVRNPVWRRVILVAAILGWSGLAFMTRGSPRLYLSIAGHGAYFLSGFLLADFYVTRWSSASPLRSWDVVTVLAWPGILAILLGGGVWRLSLPLVVAVAYAAAFRGHWTRRLLRLPALYIVGGMCYTIYLYHFAVISAVGNPLLRVVPDALPFSVSVASLGLVVLPVVLAVSSVLYLALEKPFMGSDNWLRRATRLDEGRQSTERSAVPSRVEL